VKLGITLAEAAPLEGSVAKSATIAGDETLSIPLKLDLAISNLSLLGLKLPATCAGTEALALGLQQNLTREELLSKGFSFAGTTTIPKLRCEGTFLGPFLGIALSALLSGPENAYALKITAPGG